MKTKKFKKMVDNSLNKVNDIVEDLVDIMDHTEELVSLNEKYVNELENDFDLNLSDMTDEIKKLSNENIELHNQINVLDSTVHDLEQDIILLQHRNNQIVDYLEYISNHLKNSNHVCCKDKNVKNENDEKNICLIHNTTKNKYIYLKLDDPQFEKNIKTLCDVLGLVFSKQKNVTESSICKEVILQKTNDLKNYDVIKLCIYNSGTDKQVDLLCYKNDRFYNFFIDFSIKLGLTISDKNRYWNKDSNTIKEFDFKKGKHTSTFNNNGTEYTVDWSDLVNVLNSLKMI